MWRRGLDVELPPKGLGNSQGRGLVTVKRMLPGSQADAHSQDPDLDGSRRWGSRASPSDVTKALTSGRKAEQG